MVRFLVEKPGITVLLAVFLALALSACSSGVSQNELDEANDTAENLAAMAAERTTAQTAINAASTAVAGLTAASDDAAVTAAEEAIAAATAAIAATTLLSADEVAGLNGQVTTIQTQLNGTKHAIANARSEEAMGRERTAAQTAINAASTAVAGLTTASDDAAVTAAEEAIAAATAAIAGTTVLSADEVAGLNGQVATIQTQLNGTKQAIANARSEEAMGRERTAAQTAINAASTAVAGLTTASDDAAVTAAEEAIAAATAAIAGTTVLSADEVAGLNGQVATIQTQLTGVKQVIANARSERMMATERATAQTAINTARTAVEVLTVESDDAAVMGAQTAIDNATDAIAATTVLSTDEVAGLNGQVTTIQTALNNLKQTIANNNTAAGVLAGEKTKTSNAAGEAMTASGNAGDSVTAANTARENLATMQTNEKSGMYAEAAKKYAGMAKEEYEKAKAASEAAADSDDLTEVVKQRIIAENALKAAQGHEMKAKENSDKAVMAANNDELKIVETVKSVGTTEINAMAGAHSVTINGKAVITGLVGKPMHAVEAVMGQAFTANTDPTDDVPYRQAVAAQSIAIGKTVDNADDLARLMIVDTYAGSRMVKVYADNEGEPNEDSTVAGKMTVIDGTDGVRNTEDDTYVDLKDEGTYYIVDNSGGNANELEATDVLTADAKSATVYSFMDVGPDGAVGGGDDEKVYVVQETTSTTGDVTTITYDVVDVMALSTDETTDGTAEDGPVTARKPEATEYLHVHFGVWAALGEAKDDGSQAIADHGIGFVQNISDDGMTGDDMPNNGSASYSGNWVATVQTADPDGNGDVTLENGAATLGANFGAGTISADLDGLAMLTGDIEGNTFEGDTATVVTNTYGVTEGSIDGEFSGAFFGSKAAEAGGIFDFTPEDTKAGGFRGAFGGDRDDN